MTFPQFIQKWIGKKADWDGAYAGQCVDLFRYYCHEVLGIPQPDGVWGAANFWTEYNTDPILQKHFERIPKTRDFVPKNGDVMVWNFNAGGGFGHIGMCVVDDEHPADTQYFYSFDQNWSRISYCEIVRHNYTNVYGVLRPRKDVDDMSNMYKGLDLGNPEAMKPAVDIWHQVVIEKLWVKKEELKVLFDRLGVDSMEKAVAEVQNRLEQIGRLKQQLTDEVALRIKLMDQSESREKIIKEYENELVSRQTQIDELSAKIGQQNQLIAELKKQADEGTVVLPTPENPSYVELFFKWLYERLAQK